MTGTVSAPLFATNRMRTRWAVMGLLIAFLAVVGSLQGVFLRQVIGVAFLYAVLAVSLDLAWGYMGILSIGHAVFFGIGGYALGILVVSVTSTGVVGSKDFEWWTVPAALILGVAAAVAVAAAVGGFAFSARKATPFYIAVVTLALTVIARTLLDQAQQLGGQQGLSGFRIEGPGSLGWYIISAATLVIVTYVGYRIVRSDFGLLMLAVRDNEARCRYLGYNVERSKLGVFCMSAGIAALAGVLYGGYVGFVSPPFVGFLFATEIIIWVGVGGRATLWGPIAGALAISIGGSQLSQRFPFVWTLILGAIFVAVVAFIPDGLLPAALRVFSSEYRKSVRSGTGQPGVGRRHASLTLRAAASLGLESDGASARKRNLGVGLQVRDVHRAYGALQVLRGVSFEARQGELLSVVGPNGAGKSTLLGAITDGGSEYQGEIILLDGEPLSLKGLSKQQIVHAGVGRKFQTPNLFESLTVGECLLLAAGRGSTPSLWHRSNDVQLTDEALGIIRAADLDSYTDVRVADLPHGVKQAVELSLTVSLNPKVLLLDEPTAGLTAEEREVIGRILRTLVAEGMIVILIEHDFEFVRSIADRLIVLHDGKILLDGPVAEVAASRLLRDIYLGTREPSS
jgi:branched-chain amino acid transport system permease protein